MLIAIDSNVFIAALSPHEIHSTIAQQLIRDINSGQYTAIASSIVYGEVLSVSQGTIVPDLTDFFDHIDGLRTVPATDEVCLRAAELRRQHGPKLKLPDAMHLATALMSEALVLVTNDAALAKIARTVMPTTLLPDWQTQNP